MTWKLPECDSRDCIASITCAVEISFIVAGVCFGVNSVTGAGPRPCKISAGEERGRQ